MINVCTECSKINNVYFNIRVLYGTWQNIDYSYAKSKDVLVT